MNSQNQDIIRVNRVDQESERGEGRKELTKKKKPWESAGNKELSSRHTSRRKTGGEDLERKAEKSYASAKRLPIILQVSSEEGQEETGKK